MMTSKQRRNLRKVLKHKGFSPEEIEHELNNTSGQTGEATPTSNDVERADSALFPKGVRTNARRKSIIHRMSNK